MVKVLSVFHVNTCVLIVAFAASLCAVHSQKLNCDTCIDRPSYTVKAILHGTADDKFWQQMKSAATQSGSDMRVNFQLHLYDDFDEDKMIDDIEQNTAWGSTDALIVSMPTERIADAVRNAAVNTGVPIFGVNMGDEMAQQSGVLDFVGMGQQEAGVEAAKELLKVRDTDIGRALYINHENDNLAFESRLDGFRATLQAEGATVEELIVNDKYDIENAVKGCHYDAILLASAIMLKPVTAALEKNGCPTSALASFDTNEEVFEAIGQGKLAFAVSEQPFLQGALSVLMASIFATTGKKIVPPTASKSHIYLTGPKIITLGNIPSNTMQTCQFDGFPICPNILSLDDSTKSSCQCTDRSKIKIGGVLHGVTTDVFWDPVFAASEHAAKDMGIDLILDRFEPEKDQNLLHRKMAEKMINLCQQDIDGLFVTIPSATVVEALRRCQSLNIPIISVNTGIETSEELGLMHHVGMLEYDAGVGAGKRLIESGMKIGLCLDHEPGNTALIDRCNGFEKAINDVAGVRYIGRVEVPLDNAARYKSIVENKIKNETAADDEEWRDIGLFLLGPAQTAEALLVHKSHPQVLMGSVDTSDEMYDAMDDGRILFGIQQGPYMQGYMPIPLLTWMSYTGQKLENMVIQSGPNFVESSPSESLQVCESRLFQVCGQTEAESSLRSSATDQQAPSHNKKALIASLVVVFGVVFIILGFISYRVHKLNKHVSELQQAGTNVPNMSFSSKMSSVVHPVEKVVESARMT